jgi:hypothetical protein
MRRRPRFGSVTYAAEVGSEDVTQSDALRKGSVENLRKWDGDNSLDRPHDLKEAISRASEALQDEHKVQGHRDAA